MTKYKDMQTRLQYLVMLRILPCSGSSSHSVVHPSSCHEDRVWGRHPSQSIGLRLRLELRLHNGLHLVVVRCGDSLQWTSKALRVRLCGGLHLISRVFESDLLGLSSKSLECGEEILDCVSVCHGRRFYPE